MEMVYLQLRENRKKTEIKAYILFRLYLDYNRDVQQQKNTIENSVASIKNNIAQKNSDKIILLVNDDTPDKDKCNGHDDWVRGLVGECKIPYHIFATDGEGSAYSLFNLRKQFISTSAKDKDIAIVLDQDDILTAGAINKILRIANKKKSDIIISDFTVDGECSLDITNKGGILHHQFLRQQKTIRNILPWQSFPSGIQYADSLCWSKSFSRKALAEYINAIEEMMGMDGAAAFFRMHPAFDDFIDFATVLFKDNTISTTTFVTHKYCKSLYSVTSSCAYRSGLFNRG